MVAETVLRATFNSMMQHEDLDAAIMHAMHSITYNALDLSLLPVLHERFIQRIVQLEPLLGMSTLGLMLGAPVVSMHSVLQLMNGKAVTDQDDAIALRQFIEGTVTACDVHYNQHQQQQQHSNNNNAQMLRYVGVDEQSNPSGKLQGYITCVQLKEVCVSSSSGNNGNNSAHSNGRGGSNQGQQQESSSSSNMFGSISPNGVPMIPINNVCRYFLTVYFLHFLHTHFTNDLNNVCRYFLTVYFLHFLHTHFTNDVIAGESTAPTKRCSTTAPSSGTFWGSSDASCRS
jgi:hypothetical protein